MLPIYYLYTTDVYTAYVLAVHYLYTTYILRGNPPTYPIVTYTYTRYTTNIFPYATCLLPIYY